MSTMSVTVERTTNRTSRAILTDDGILIRLAGRLPRWMEEEHIALLTKRMGEAAKRHVAKTPIDPFREVIAGKAESRVCLGDGRTFTVRRRTGHATRIRMSDTCWELTVSPKQEPRALHRLLWRTLCAAELPRMTAEVALQNAMTFGFAVGTVSLKYTATQWGSCSSRGGIALSGALLFVPEHLQRYVIVHELAHLQQRNHGKRFWALVASALPDYRQSIAALRGYRMVRLQQRSSR